MNVRSRILQALHLVYKQALSPVLHSLAIMPAGCRFLPTCSEYAVLAVHEHGAARGGWMAFCRVLRCRPGFLGGGSGFDPVPPKTPLRRSSSPPVTIEETQSLPRTRS